MGTPEPVTGRRTASRTTTRGPTVKLFPPRREIRIVLLYIAGFVVVLAIMLFVALRIA
ncbi:hypothetical protein [Nocardioides flavescens]|uniref:Uncharacterized protein n=1 Tax=Nocardioides flavescens TaxID=2691959 RepID=A0A6L7EXD9_9ACTN|nr:hypothetical protein [Nocardioides flavescens]MXG90138.1 hypothetical protein [Nocardioides flavescens]